MTMRYAIIDTDAKTVINIVEYEDRPVGALPGFSGNVIAIADDLASPGWGWNGTATFNPTPPLPEPPPSIISQDLMAQFTAADAMAIQAAISGNVQFWLLWQALTTQKDPMLVTNARFLAGWGALVQVLGQSRMDAIASALGVTVA